MNKLRPILLALTAIAVTSLFSAQPARAFTITMNQVGSNVVANGSGAFNLTGLTFLGAGQTVSHGIVPITGSISMGDGLVATIDRYTGFTGPTSFGSGSPVSADTGSGDVFGFLGAIVVPQGYVSGTTLSASISFTNSTFASLGVTLGTYVWSWGDGADQRFTLQIGPAGVPDGGSTVSLLGCALLGLAALRRKLGC
jgi:protein with PEP-CTERM/exosortase system signal